MSPERTDRFIQVLLNTIPACAGNGMDVAEVAGGYWFTSTHPGLTTTLWVRAGGPTHDPHACLRYAVAGSARVVEVERDRWDRVVRAADRALLHGADAGGLSPSLHSGSGAVPDAKSWVASMGGPLVVVPESARSRWGGFGNAGEPTGLTDYDRACAVPGRAGVLDLDGGGQALVLRNRPIACYLAERRLFVHWVGADSETDVLLAAENVLADAASEWERCGTWEVDGPAVLMDSFVGGPWLSADDAERGGLPQPVPVEVAPGRWTLRAGQWSVPVNAGWPVTVGLVQLLPEG